ncbi:hypothetical protein ACWEQO_02090 [Streptomyces sp. NPDC004051]
MGNELSRVMGRYITAGIADAVRAGVTAGGRQAQAPAARQGQSTGSTFARSFKGQLQAALANLPEVRLRADSSDAQRELYDIRAQMMALRDVRIGIDVDAATASAAMTQLQARLDRLSASDADVQIRVDAAAASTQLAAFNAQVSRVDGRTARVDVDTRSGAASLNLLAASAMAFGPAILPVLPVVAAGLGAIAAAGAAAAAGVGGIALVAVPAFKQIGTVLQAQKAAQDAATQSTGQGGQAAAQAAQRSMQMASAQQSLATAHRNAARQIRQAEQGVADAARDSAESTERAADQVKQAKQGLADAVQQAADRQRQSAEQIRSAEESLADAQRTARQAQEDLTDARKDAARQLEDLESRLANASLSERDAVLAVQEAQEKLTRMREAGDAVSLRDQQRIQLSYDQAVQRLKDQQSETKRLSAEKEAADRAGVDGSDRVLDAQERLRQAEAGVARQQKALSKAREDAARQAVRSQRDIAEAQERVAEAQRNVTRTQEDGARSVARAQEQLAQAQQSAADSISSAQRQMAQAQQSGAASVDQAALAQQRYQAELAKLTPAARETMAAYTGLRDAFGAWSKSLQPAVMPIFTRALNAMKRALPGLTPFVTEAADAIQGLMDRASAELKKPFWKDFRDDLAGAVKPAIEGFGVAFGNVFKGMAGVISAFLPHMDSISGRMQDITKKFADWGSSLKGSPEFERFLSYSSEMAPKIWEALRSVSGAALAIGQAMAPISSIVLQVITWLGEGIQWVADTAPWVVQGIYGIVVAMSAWRLGVMAWTAVQKLATLALRAFNLVSKAGPWGWIILGITAVVLAVTYLYKRFSWFREGVQVVWDWLKTASLWLWETVLKPVFTWIGDIVVWLWQKIIKPYIGFVISYWKMVAKVAMWLWKNVLAPVFRGIGEVISWWWKNIVQRYFRMVRGAVKTLGEAFQTAYSKAIKPAWDKVSSVISAVWEKGIKPAFGSVKSGVRLVGEAFEAARKAIKKAWDKISGIAKKPVEFVANTVYNKGIRKVWGYVTKAFGGDPLPEFTGFASGGVLPGYTPGRDVHRFVSPTGGGLELSGGEAIMRPEFTRAVGSGFVHSMNAIARTGGAQGVKAALAPMLGGNPSMPTDRSLKYSSGGVVQRFADGGIFGWIKSAAKAGLGAGSAAWNKVKEAASWLTDGLEASARAGMKNVVDPLLKRFPGMDTGFGKLIRRIPGKVIDRLFGYSKEADKRGAGGIGGPRIQAGLKWAKTQHGKPYQWGGNGNPSWDCSGFVSAIESVIRGQKPHRRWATGAFSGRTAPPGWVKNGNSPYRIGITNAGVGHTSGTLGKTNVESRGGDGVVVGSRARSYKSSLYTDWYGFQPGKYDQGGMLQPGFNLAYNGTGRPEPVLTGAQFNALARGSQQQPVVVELHAREGELGQFIDVRVQDHQQQLIQVLNAS